MYYPFVYKPFPSYGHQTERNSSEPKQQHGGYGKYSFFKSSLKVLTKCVFLKSSYYLKEQEMVSDFSGGAILQLVPGNDVWALAYCGNFYFTSLPSNVTIIFPRLFCYSMKW